MPKPRSRGIPQELRWEAVELHGMICHLCGGVIERLSELSIDHVRPRSRGGRTVIDNLRPAHRTCNHIKANLTPDTDRRVARGLTAWANRKGARRRR